MADANALPPHVWRTLLALAPSPRDVAALAGTCRAAHDALDDDVAIARLAADWPPPALAARPAAGPRLADAPPLAQWRWWATGASGWLRPTRDVDTLPAVVAGVHARLGAVLSGRFLLRPAGAATPAVALPAFAAGLAAVAESGVAGDVPAPGGGDRWDVVWWHT